MKESTKEAFLDLFIEAMLLLIPTILGWILGLYFDDMVSPSLCTYSLSGLCIGTLVGAALLLNYIFRDYVHEQ